MVLADVGDVFGDGGKLFGRGNGVYRCNDRLGKRSYLEKEKTRYDRIYMSIF